MGTTARGAGMLPARVSPRNHEGCNTPRSISILTPLDVSCKPEVARVNYGTFSDNSSLNESRSRAPWHLCRQSGLIPRACSGRSRGADTPSPIVTVALGRLVPETGERDATDGVPEAGVSLRDFHKLRRRAGESQKHVLYPKACGSSGVKKQKQEQKQMQENRGKCGY
jgi:hypothetical protein